MKTHIYPAIFHTEDVGYSITFTDLLGCISEGDSLEEALKMAEDALGIYLYTLSEDGISFPIASNPAEIKLAEKEFVSLIVWDKIEYLKRTDNKAVKKILTIPSWLNYLAEKENINFSGILQKALKERLQLN